MRRVLVATPLAVLALAGPALAQMSHDHPGAEPGPVGRAKVSIFFAAFGTPKLDVVTGDTVLWSNDSARAHDVVSAGLFDSGNLRVGATFARRFDTQGTIPYYCSLHPFMTGEVDVHDILLDVPPTRGSPGKPYVLTGRVAEGLTGSVSIEEVGSGAPVPAGTAAVGSDGAFRATVTPRTTTTYRARTGASTSPPVLLPVLDRRVTVSASPRRDHRTNITVRVTPPSAGATVVLQLHLKDRFGWWPVAREKLDNNSGAVFRVTRRSRAAARVLLTQPDGATELARSRTVHVGTPQAPMGHRLGSGR